MANCVSLKQIFENPLPPNPTFIESLSSWTHQIKYKPLDVSSFTEIFGELHFKDPSPCIPLVEEVVNPPRAEVEKYNVKSNVNNHQFKSKAPDVSSFTELFGELYFNDPSALPVSPLKNANPQTKVGCFDDNSNNNENGDNDNIERTKSAASDNESSSSTTTNNQHVEAVNLQLCTEGLGFESSDVEKNESADEDPKVSYNKRPRLKKHSSFEERVESRKLRRDYKSFPPPISSIGGNGKPWLYFKSFRHEGRFILKQIRIPTQVFFNAYREDGHLRLHPVRAVEDVGTNEEQKDDNVHELDIDAEKEEGGRNEKMNAVDDKITPSSIKLQNLTYGHMQSAHEGDDGPGASSHCPRETETSPQFGTLPLSRHKIGHVTLYIAADKVYLGITL
ncbi:hypothetical protein IFM89_028269 [Coptis chinensis]|uniref:FAF domain-containing protein n=1 Tax=Coptis chinensis TaxID=261450 RepID=A0A835LKU2_9MAGN|nr:hypothetical protein IFM89_028269 [Coptis chinensis]